MKQSWWQLLPALLLAYNVQAEIDPAVQVTLRSSWPAPPPAIEVLETVSLENPNAFFDLLDLLTDPDRSLPPARLIHPAVALKIAVDNKFLTDPGARELVELNLGLHAATPKIEALYQYYEDHYNATRGEQCGSWVDWYGEVVCDLNTLVQLAGTETTTPSNRTSFVSPFTRPKLLTFDHIHPSPTQTPTPPPRTAIIYASLSSPNFRGLHTYLLSLANKPTPEVEYVFRYIPPATRQAMDELKANYLSGYGVALDVKKTDYLAVDDRHSVSRATREDADVTGDEEWSIDPIVKLIATYPENTTPLHSPLSEDEIQALGPQAIQLLLTSPTPFQTLTRLSQNLPIYTSLLSRRVLANSSITDEIHVNSLKVQGGLNMFWVNGAVLQEKDINPFALVRMLRRERGVVRALTGAGALAEDGKSVGKEARMGRAQALELLTHPNISAAQSEKDVLEGLFDASDRLEGGDIITWWNDLQRDSRYARWSASLYVLLQPLYPGQLPSVKLNLFNIVLVLDLSKVESLGFIAGPVANIINKKYPLRFGVVPFVGGAEEDGARMARLFYYIIHRYGRKTTLEFIQKISQPTLARHSESESTKIDWSLVRSTFEQLQSATEGNDDPEDPATDDTVKVKDKVKLDDILDGNLDYVPPLEQARLYAERLAVSDGQNHAFINGKHFDVDGDFVRNMQMEIGKQIQFLQERVYEGKIKDEHNEALATYFYDQPSTNQRRNIYIYPPATESLKIFNVVDLFAPSRTGFDAFADAFVYPQGTQRVVLSLYVVADLDSKHGLEFVKEALRSMSVDSRTRISFVHNPAGEPIETPEGNRGRPSGSQLISHLISSGTWAHTSPLDLMLALGLEDPATADDIQVQNQNQVPLMSQQESVDKVTGSVKVPELNPAYVRASQLVARELGVLPGQQVLLVNGRVVGPIEPGEFSAMDHRALESYEIKKRGEPVMNALADVLPGVTDYDRESYADIVSVAASVISAIQQPDPSEFSLLDAPPRPRQRPYQKLEAEYTVLQYGDNSTALYHVAVILDPLSETAQRWSSLLEWLMNIPDMFIEVHLNPAPYTEIPLKRFYRYNLQRTAHYDDDLEERASLAEFKGLPIEPIYTLAMDVPSSWLVRPREARYDLDNIQLSHLSHEHPIVHAGFDLDYLVVEGHARQGSTNSPPRGVQLELVRGSTPVDDTQVVANLGYLQFKAKPGVFQLGIRKGRGREIFKMESVGNEGWDSPGVEEGGSEITLTSFEGLTLFPRLSRLPGMETADVLEEARSEPSFGGLFGDITSRVTSLFKPKESAVIPSQEQAEINIFTVASGLLYERFVSIMILSVLRNTKSTVKFWFIENFLSPSFLEFMPHFAEAYNFKYELVTYKWPSWLRAQKEKQRIIWAYKILFLDVLFPMDLKKVIFVDADQIVRADLKELVDLNLHGAPYGYTPMGDDNTDMEGFRFWKTGYWKDFLQGRPYHISALYVVDLVRFRQLAAGDMLRGQYQGLSGDPNSLANLDQDLPNNLQREVPIFSLHEDWLWCETWCSKDRLHKAKTIDLCQNPLTKEPKLARARKIPEWEAYDTEIARFARKLAEDGVIRSGMAAADANVLANEGAVPQSSSTTTTDEPSSVSAENHSDQKRDEL